MFHIHDNPSAEIVCSSKIFRTSWNSDRIHFSRDPIRGVNLNLDDEKLKEEKLVMREVNQKNSRK